MALTRESTNWIKIEKNRIGGVPIDPTETIYQGDALKWDGSAHAATKAGPSATTFMGVSETKNPIATLGSPDLLGNLTNNKVNVITAGLIERIAEHAETLYGFDKLAIGSNDQKVSKLWATDANYAYVVDPKWATASGKAVVAGDSVRCWIHVRPQYNPIGGADTPES